MKLNNRNSKRLLIATVDLVKNLDEFDGRCSDQVFVDEVYRALIAYCKARDWNEIINQVAKLKEEKP